MKPLGISNPWLLPKPPPEDPLAGAVSGSTRVALDGRFWCYTIQLPLRPKKEKAETLTLQVFGEFVIALHENFQEEFLQLLKKQQLSMDAPYAGTANVRIALGPVNLYGTASSTQAELAAKMLLDRFALVLNELNHTHSKVLEELCRISGISWARRV